MTACPGPRPGRAVAHHGRVQIDRVTRRRRFGRLGRRADTIGQRLMAVRRRLIGMERRPAALISAAICLIPIVFVLVVPHPVEQAFGVDRDLYLGVTRRWLDGGPYFESYQLAGPYLIRAGDVLYPPVALLLFVPFALGGAIGSVAWLVPPLAGTVACIARLRPRPAAWPLLALCATNPTTLLKIWTGNPVIWSMLALAVATISPRWRAAAPISLLKPSLAPFALFGANRRSWWAGLAVGAVVCVPFGAMWGDWVASIVNSRGGGLLYSALEVPILALPLVAWLGRTRGG